MIAEEMDVAAAMRRVFPYLIVNENREGQSIVIPLATKVGTTVQISNPTTRCSGRGRASTAAPAARMSPTRTTCSVARVTAV
jgi:hypothetical protein